MTLRPRAPVRELFNVLAKFVYKTDDSGGTGFLRTVIFEGIFVGWGLLE